MYENKDQSGKAWGMGVQAHLIPAATELYI